MTKNNYSNIRSFEDFRKEKMRLFYEIRLSEKKLEIKKMELQEYLNPIRFITAIFNELSKPLFSFIKSFAEGIIKRTKENKEAKAQKKSSESSSDKSED
ncbi:MULTISPECIES: hypothetical protein [unclassified Saccharicrinis]|uniref:hypothetical protein n=1 Tax=unclassified Saccharicrinis TaxID=2646859 RepID=UPI003D348DCC